jgi:hypothetical protein
MSIYLLTEGFLDPGRPGPGIVALDGGIDAVLAAVRGLLARRGRL